MEVAGSIVAAARWAHLLFSAKDGSAAWDLTDPDLQLARVQSWFLVNGREDASFQTAAEALARSGSSSPEWRAFDEWNRQRLDRALGPLLREPWAPFSEVEPVGLDLELVALTPDSSGGRAVPAGQPLVAQLIVMRWRDEWRVAGLGRSLAIPGWPPTEVEVREQYG